MTGRANETVEQAPTYSRTLIVEGTKVAVDERPRVIPPALSLLLEGGRGPDARYWSPMRVAFRDPLRISGPRAECMDQDHRLRRWLEGFATGSDGIVRFLSLWACADCGAVCVRDRSFDTRAGLVPGRKPLRRVDHVIGWYSGARRANRVYT